MRQALLALVATVGMLVALPASASAGPVDVLHGVVTYVPNRVLDVLDIVRARVRVGPGLAVGARATEAADVYAGSYWTLYAGLPGPRGRRLPRLPVGIETRTGVEVSVADASTGLGFAPDYGVAEFGAGFQLLGVGMDVGIDPLEIFDLVAGFFFFDPRDDDF